MALVYESKSGGLPTRVFSDRVEYKTGWFGGDSSIPIKQIAGVESAAIANTLTLTTTGGQRIVIRTPRKREVSAAIYWALNGAPGTFTPPEQPKTSPLILVGTVAVAAVLVLLVAAAMRG